MNYEEAVTYVHSICWRGSRPGLSRIETLLKKLGNPQENLQCIHVAGTNGKGSVCAMLSSILEESGYKVGRFVSPYIRHFRERIAINGQPIAKDDFAQITTKVQVFAEEMEDPPTEFELITAIGFSYFAQEHCDVVVLEAGMGGRLDSTNIITNPLLSVITGVDLDHTAFLGDTVEQIAKEKAGIIKESCPVVFGGMRKEALPILIEAAQEKNATLQTVDLQKIQNKKHTLQGTTLDFGSWKGIEISLLGSYQPENAATVLTAIEILQTRGIVCKEEAVRRGLFKTKWPGRFEQLCEEPRVIFDGGHNEQGIKACISSIKQYFPNQQVFVLMGVMRDKAYAKMTQMLKGVAKTVYTVTPDNPRALGSEELAEILQKNKIPAQAFFDVKDAVQTAMAIAKNEQRPLIIMGSLYLYAQASCAVEEILAEKYEMKK